MNEESVILPPEVWKQIITCIGMMARKRWAKQTLKAMSLVCKLFRNFARPLLWRSPKFHKLFTLTEFRRMPTHYIQKLNTQCYDLDRYYADTQRRKLTKFIPVISGMTQLVSLSLFLHSHIDEDLLVTNLNKLQNLVVLDLRKMYTCPRRFHDSWAGHDNSNCCWAQKLSELTCLGRLKRFTLLSRTSDFADHEEELMQLLPLLVSVKRLEITNVNTKGVEFIRHLIKEASLECLISDNYFAVLESKNEEDIAALEELSKEHNNVRIFQRRYRGDELLAKSMNFACPSSSSSSEDSDGGTDYTNTRPRWQIDPPKKNQH